MFGKKLVTMIVVGVASIALPAFSQSELETSGHEIAGQAFGSFVMKTTKDGVRNRVTDSGGVWGEPLW